MVEISIPITNQPEGGKGKGFFTFALNSNAILFAGSRNLTLAHATCLNLINALGRIRNSFLVGCAPGIDKCFRRALAQSQYSENVFVACAFTERLQKSYGLFASVVVPQGLMPKIALRRRTLWMVKRCSTAVLFPDNPYTQAWGRGSRLVFKAALYQLKPLFIVTQYPPKKNAFYHVFPSSLFGVVSGFWVVPHPLDESRMCDDEL